jgi:AcrR family transcriptional regulator
MVASESKARRRLPPEARRQQIILAARQVFAMRPYEQVSTADVAAAAGVTRALVHHYFGGIDEVRQAVALQIVRSAAGTLRPSDEDSVIDRVRANVGRFLDAVDANRDAWFAALGTGSDVTATPAGRTLRKAVLEQILANNAAIIDDTAWARLCLGGYIAFSDAICRRWLDGGASRAEVECALSQTLLHLLLDTIPAGESIAVRDHNANLSEAEGDAREQKG